MSVLINWGDRTGENNNNFKGAGWHICQRCGAEFKDYQKNRKYCSLRCRDVPKAPRTLKRSSRVRIVPGVAPSRKPARDGRMKGTSVCVVCSAVFPVGQRKYCDSCWRTQMGQRRGTARKVDSNQNEIVQALRRIGCHVLELSAVGGGVPDLVVWKRDGISARLVEIKNPAAKGKLNKLQQAWHLAWTGAKPLVIETIEQALAEFQS